MIRRAILADLNALVDLENRAFELDRLSRRSFRYLISKANAETLVKVNRGKVVAYAMLLFNMGTSLARLYSIAVDAQLRSKGLGQELLEALETTAIEHDCITLRLEVRQDNDRAIRFYTNMGYKPCGHIDDYYEDHMSALRFEKSLAPQFKPELARVPFYEQTLDFTCGPSALMMAMKSLDSDLDLNRKLELRLWREATTIYMTSGHGGCGPFGMAISAYRHGFNVEVYVNNEDAMFIDSVRSAEKKEVMRLVQEDFTEQLQQLPVKIHYRAINVEELKIKFNQGGIPIVLISSYRIYQEKFPHWVVVTGFDERYIYVHDPFVDYEVGKTATDCINMPILQKDFQRMARYGKAGQKAVLILKQDKRRKKKQ